MDLANIFFTLEGPIPRMPSSSCFVCTREADVLAAGTLRVHERVPFHGEEQCQKVAGLLSETSAGYHFHTDFTVMR